VTGNDVISHPSVDYLPKPFNPRELLARIRAVLRRAGAASPAVDRNARMLTFLDWRIDCRLRELRDPQGTRIVLTGAEFALLQVLCERAGRCSRASNCWI
jgi:two-component system, OmpR family, response regulator